jgi:hypothetical protein
LRDKDNRGEKVKMREREREREREDVYRIKWGERGKS